MKRWPTKPLGELLKVQNGFAFKSELFNEDGKGLPIIRIRDLARGFSETFYESEHDPAFEVESGDFLIGMDGEFRCYRWQGGKALLNQRVCRLQNFNRDLNAGYVFYGINDHLRKIEDNTAFVTVKHLSSKQIASIEMNVPSLTEQGRMVKLLDEADELRKLRAQANRGTAGLIPALFHEMFGPKQQSKAGWILKPLEELTTRVTKGESPGWQGFEYTEKGPLFVTSQNVLWGELELSEPKYIPMEFHKKLSRSAIQPNDVLLNLVGASIGRACIFPPDKGDANVNQAVAVISCGEGIMPEFLLHLLLSDDAQSIFHGGKVEAARANISLSDIRQFKSILPPLTLQKEFAARVSEIRAVQSEQAISHRRLDELFQSMLHRAFNGEL